MKSNTKYALSIVIMLIVSSFTFTEPIYDDYSISLLSILILVVVYSTYFILDKLEEISVGVNVTEGQENGQD